MDDLAILKNTLRENVLVGAVTLNLTDIISKQKGQNVSPNKGKWNSFNCVVILFSEVMMW